MTANICNNPFGGDIVVLETTDSTMQEAAKHWQAYRQYGTVMCARHQTHGRGRVADRQWNDIAGQSLLFTLTLDPQQVITGMPLSLGVALAIARSIESIGTKNVSIKWPNDVLADGKKLAGILCQGKPDVMFCGIGVNVLQERFDGDYRTLPTSLRLQGHTDVEPLDLISPVLMALEKTLYHEENWHAEISVRLHGLGQRATMQSGEPERGQVQHGILRGIGSQGQAILDCDGDLIEIYSGELA